LHRACQVGRAAVALQRGAARRGPLRPRHPPEQALRGVRPTASAGSEAGAQAMTAATRALCWLALAALSLAALWSIGGFPALAAVAVWTVSGVGAACAVVECEDEVRRRNEG